MAITITVSIQGAIEGQVRTVVRPRALRDVHMPKVIAYLTDSPDYGKPVELGNGTTRPPTERKMLQRMLDATLQGIVDNVKRHATEAERARVVDPVID